VNDNDEEAETVAAFRFLEVKVTSVTTDGIKEGDTGDVGSFSFR
jgi:hypothetical protein